MFTDINFKEKYNLIFLLFPINICNTDQMRHKCYSRYFKYISLNKFSISRNGLNHFQRVNVAVHSDMFVVNIKKMTNVTKTLGVWIDA